MEKDQNREEFVHAISEMAEIMNQNAYQMYLICAPVVESLCKRNAPEEEVNHCFDTLLDYAYDENVLSLFKKLGRHYYKIYPDSVLFYVKECIKMWSEESENEQDGTDIENE